MRKAFIFTIILAMVLSLTACGDKETEKPMDTTEEKVADKSDAAEVEEPAEVKEVITLTMITYTDWYSDGWAALEAYINENSEKLGFKLDIQKIAGGEQGDQLYQVKFATGELPDIIQSYGAKWIDTNADGLDKMVDLSGIDTSDYDQQIIDSSFKYKGKLYGMPLNTVNLSGVFYNKDLFEQAGVEIPTTWDEFLTVCETLQAAGITPVYASYKDAWSAQLFPLSGLTSDIVESGDTFNEYIEKLSTNQLTYSDASNFIGSIKRSKELIDLGYVNETYLSDTYDGAQTALAEGEAAMYINATWTIDGLVSKYPEKSDVIGAFALPMPSGDNYVNIWLPTSIGVTASSENIDIAKKAVEFIVSAEAQQIYASAQPGIYLNKNVQADLPAAMQDLKNVIDSGKGMTDWEGEVLYPYGNFGEFMVNYFIGEFETAEEVAAAMDEETKKNANANSDSNWEE